MNRLKDVKPGDLVYCIDDDGEDFSGYLFMGTCNNYVIVCSTDMDFVGDFDSQLEDMCIESMKESGIEVCIYPIEKVFLTESETMAHMH